MVISLKKILKKVTFILTVNKMKATNKILSLLHDTLIEKVKFKNNNLILFFYFYLGDTTIEQNEYIVKFNNKNISDISCYEHYRDETKKERD